MLVVRSGSSFPKSIPSLLTSFWQEIKNIDTAAVTIASERKNIFLEGVKNITVVFK
jgi:hypothetical protein